MKKKRRFKLNFTFNNMMDIFKTFIKLYIIVSNTIILTFIILFSIHELIRFFNGSLKIDLNYLGNIWLYVLSIFFKFLFDALLLLLSGEDFYD